MASLAAAGVALSVLPSQGQESFNATVVNTIRSDTAPIEPRDIQDMVEFPVYVPSRVPSGYDFVSASAFVRSGEAEFLELVVADRETKDFILITETPNNLIPGRTGASQRRVQLGRMEGIVMTGDDVGKPTLRSVFLSPGDVSIVGQAFLSESLSEAELLEILESVEPLGPVQ